MKLRLVELEKANKQLKAATSDRNEAMIRQSTQQTAMLMLRDAEENMKQLDQAMNAVAPEVEERASE
ncbi:hypothetical protein [Novipirellula artificiosorum]|uniref:Uncharacterized protein n=1 Tax=Novipirellula artificiosorum TaxID=2528016 RepID=A0A5C6DWX0_9BACT|nr:hypothetical protein [Novipirellula artificiosorum]TWU41132.1 hypothetical protein Poly41_19700 [Novipirellula artificiosorum]